MLFERRSPVRTAARVPVLLAAGALLPAAAGAQSVTERINVLAEDNARRYAQPVVSGIGSGLGAGLFEGAGSADGVQVRVGLQASGSLIPDRDDAFEPVLPEEITYRERTFADPYAIAGERSTTPTASGAGTGVVVEPTGDFEAALRRNGRDPADYEIRFPHGVDLPAVPLAAAEASVSLPFGTAVAGRFLPETEVSDDVGPVSSFGFGLRQSVTSLLGPAPVDAAVAAGYQRLSLGDVAEASARSASVIVSRDLELITVFASGGVEDSSVDVEYTFESPANIPGRPAAGETVAFEAEGENASRFTGGIRLDLFAARVSVAYSISAYDMLQARVSYGF